MQIFRIKAPPLIYISINISNISDIDLTPYLDACELLKKFIELFVELNAHTSNKRIVILDKTVSLKLIENTTEFTFPDDHLDRTRMIANLLNTIDYARKKESIEDAIEFWKKYSKFEFDDEIIPLLYNAKSIIKLISSSDVCYIVNF
ncbi:MAG: hypothetical protein QXD86_06870 [Candidatus Bathyarchaeia archaeon]